MPILGSFSTALITSYFSFKDKSLRLGFVLGRDPDRLSLHVAAARIHVSVLEGPFTVLSEVGVPLPVCISMQSKGLQLDKALWTARQSNGGFSQWRSHGRAW